MQTSDTARLMHMITALEGRDVGPFEQSAWHMVIGDLAADDVRDAAIAHYRTSTDRLMPAHIVQAVKATPSTAAAGE